MYVDLNTQYVRIPMRTNSKKIGGFCMPKTDLVLKY